MRAANEGTATVAHPFDSASLCRGQHLGQHRRRSELTPVITGTYPVTWITSLCEPIRSARLFDRSPAARAVGPRAPHRAGSRHSLHHHQLTTEPHGATSQPTPQEGSNGTLS